MDYFSYPVFSTQERAGNMMRTIDKNQYEAVTKPDSFQSEVMKKLADEEKILAVFEEQKETLHRMNTYCKNTSRRTSQKLVCIQFSIVEFRMIGCFYV